MLFLGTQGNILFQFRQYQIFDMSLLSVLEEQEAGAADLLRCKLNYLQAENIWMGQEYSALCQLVDLQKQIIHSDPETQPQIASKVTEVLQKREQTLKVAKERVEAQPQGQMEAEEFISFIYSFEEKLERLQKEIKKRQATLQQIEQDKANESQQKTPQFKSIATNDPQARLLDRVKKEIAVQQVRKQQLQNDLLALADKGEEESTLASQTQSRGHPPVIEEQSSVFERLIMLLKKKRFQNGCLQEKTAKLRKALQQKKVSCGRLLEEVEAIQWNCFDGVVGAGGFLDAEKGDLSLAGKSFSNNNMSFSFDVSRFITQKQLRHGLTRE